MDDFGQIINEDVSRQVGYTLLVVLMAFVAILVLYIVFRLLAIWYLKRNASRFRKLEENLFQKVDADSMKLLDSSDDYRNTISSLGLNKTIECSSSVVVSAGNNPAKYVLKYANLDYSLETMERLEYIKELIVLHDGLLKAWENIGQRYKKKITILLRPFISRQKVIELLCGNYKALRRFHKPCMIFSYTSPAGRSTRSCRITVNFEIVQELIYEISGRIDKQGHAKRQRGAMSADLREAIKQRDGYTCQICGNSVYNEPNLLLEVDHIIPIAEGGETRADNLQTLCWRCNRAKGKKR